MRYETHKNNKKVAPVFYDMACEIMQYENTKEKRKMCGAWMQQRERAMGKVSYMRCKKKEHFQ